MLYGRLPTIRTPAGKRVKSYSSASAQCTVKRGGGNSAASREARSRSISIASIFPSFCRRGPVSAPSPGPISTMKSSLEGLMDSTRRASTRGSCRKCWPKRLRGRCEFDRKLGGLDQAARVGLPGASKRERGAMVDRGADERQAKRHGHAAPEPRVFEHRKALVVVHGERAIGCVQPLRHEPRVRGDRAARRNPRGRRSGNRRRDDLDVLAPEVARFSAVRIEPGDQNARPSDAKTRAQVSVEDMESSYQIFGCDCARHLGK